MLLLLVLLLALALLFLLYAVVVVLCLPRDKSVCACPFACFRLVERKTTKKITFQDLQGVSLVFTLITDYESPALIFLFFLAALFFPFLKKRTERSMNSHFFQVKRAAFIRTKDRKDIKDTKEAKDPTTAKVGQLLALYLIQPLANLCLDYGSCVIKPVAE